MKKLQIRFAIFGLAIVMVIFATMGCGPSREEIMARELTRLEAEAREKAEAEAKARRQAEEARLERIRAAEVAEAAGDEDAGQGQLEKALGNYQEVLRNVPRYSAQDLRVRQAAIRVARAMSVPPPVPESVLRSMVLGQTRVKMGGAGSYEAAAEEIEQAVLAAPWLADGYYDLGVIQEKAGKFSQATQNFKLYLLAAPQSRNATPVQVKIYELERMKKEKEKDQ